MIFSETGKRWVHHGGTEGTESFRVVLFSAERAENKTLHALRAACLALALTFHDGAGEFGDRRDTGEMTYARDAYLS